MRTTVCRSPTSRALEKAPSDHLPQTQIQAGDPISPGKSRGRPPALTAEFIRGGDREVITSGE